MAGTQAGDAIFSTQLGRFPPRDAAVMPPRIVLRSDPDEDMEAKIAELQTRYPAQCKAIQMPVDNIHTYFDTYDQHLHGHMFLHAVLHEIYVRNTIRREPILDYTERWLQLNPTAFDYIHQYELNAFTEDDLQEYGADFLKEVLQELQLRRTKQLDADALVNNKAYLQTQERIQQANTMPYSILPPQEQGYHSNARHNSSAPTSSHVAFAQLQVTPSIPSSTPRTPSVILPHPRTQLPPKPLESTSTRQLEPPLRSAPPYPSRRLEHSSDSNDSGIIVSRPGFSDTNVAMPPPVGIPGPSTIRRLPVGHREILPARNKPRTSSWTRTPQHTGPPNDARTFEQQNWAQLRASFWEGQQNRAFHQSHGQSIPYPKHHLPLELSQPYEAHSGFPSQGIGHSSFEPNNFARRVGPSEDSSVSNITGRKSTQSNQNTIVGAYFDRCHEPGRQAHPTAPQQFTTPPRRNEGSIRKSWLGERATPPFHVQRRPDANTIDSHTRNRFSNASSRVCETTSDIHNVGESGSTPNSRAHRSDQDWPLSDRKVWVGGLMPETNIGVIERLLEPWGPVTLSKLFLSNKWTKANHELPKGFAFAGFETPHKAAEAIEALNEKYVDSLHHKIFLKPAYIRPEHGHFNGSPKRGDPQMNRRSERQVSVDYGKEDLKRTSPIKNPAGAGEVAPALSKTFDEAPHGHESPSTERSALATGAQDPSLASQSPSHLQLQSSGGTHKPRAGTQISHMDEIGMVNRSDFGKAQSNAPPAVTSSAIDDTRVAVPSSVSKTPSPRKKKPRNASRDESPTTKTAQVKQRKEILSNLRTEKPNTLASDSHTHNMSTDQQAPDSNTTNRVDGGRKSGDQGVDTDNTTTPSFESHGSSDIAGTARLNASKEQLSPVQSASAHSRKISSTSMYMSTDPTSYAQSEHSESCVGDVGTSSIPVQAGQFTPVPQSTYDSSKAPIDLSKLNRKLSKEDPESHILAQANDQTSQKVLHTNTLLVSEPSSTPVPSLVQDFTVEDGQSTALLPVSDKLEVKEVPHSDTNEKSSVRDIKSGNFPSVVESGQPSDLRRSEIEQIRASTDDREASVKNSQLDIPAKSSSDKQIAVQPPSTSNPAAKRRLPKDPNVLIAVPKILPSAKPKPQPRGTKVQQTKPSAGQINPPKTDNANSVPIPESPSKLPNPPLVLNIEAEKEHIPEISETQDEEPHPATVDKALTSDVVKETSKKEEDISQASAPISVLDSLRTIEDDRLDPDTSTPQSFAAAMLDLANTALEKQSLELQPVVEQQPVIEQQPMMEQQPVEEQPPTVQQKKKKAKKGKKKAKKSKASQADSVDEKSNTQAEPEPVKKEEQATKTIQVETPFLSDDKKPLPIPLFFHNYSLMRSRSGLWPGSRSPNQPANPPVKKRGQESFDVFNSRSSNSKEPVGQDSTLSDFDSQPESSESETVNTQGTSTSTRKLNILSEGQDSSQTVDEATREARVKELDEYIMKNDLPSRNMLKHMLNEICPKNDIDEIEDPSPHLESEGSNEPNVANKLALVELSSEDEAHISSPPTTPLKQRNQRLLPSRDASPIAASSEGTAKETQCPESSNRVEHQDRSISKNVDTTASFQSARETSLERGRTRSVSPAKGLGLSAGQPESSNVENVSPSRLPRRTLSYKQAASTPSIQPGEILEVISKESDHEGKDGQEVTVRKLGPKDPWRVPSSELPWGGPK